jgi:hypothetical protein
VGHGTARDGVHHPRDVVRWFAGDLGLLGCIASVRSLTSSPSPHAAGAGAGWLAAAQSTLGRRERPVLIFSDSVGGCRRPVALVNGARNQSQAGGWHAEMPTDFKNTPTFTLISPVL